MYFSHKNKCYSLATPPGSPPGSPHATPLATPPGTPPGSPPGNKKQQYNIEMSLKKMEQYNTATHRDRPVAEKMFLVVRRAYLKLLSPSTTTLQTNTLQEIGLNVEMTRAKKAKHYME